MLGGIREKSDKNVQNHQTDKMIEIEDKQIRENKREDGEKEKGDEEEMNMKRQKMIQSSETRKTGKDRMQKSRICNTYEMTQEEGVQRKLTDYRCRMRESAQNSRSLFRDTTQQQQHSWYSDWATGWAIEKSLYDCRHETKTLLRDRVAGAHRLLSNSYRRKSSHKFPSMAEVENEWSNTSTPPRIPTRQSLFVLSFLIRNRS